MLVNLMLLLINYHYYARIGATNIFFDVKFVLRIRKRGSRGYIMHACHFFSMHSYISPPPTPMKFSTALFMDTFLSPDSRDIERDFPNK